MKHRTKYAVYRLVIHFKQMSIPIFIFILLMFFHFSWYFYIRSYGMQIREIHTTLTEIHQIDQQVLASPMDPFEAIQTLENSNHALENSFHKLLNIRPAFNCIPISELMAYNLDYESNLIEISIAKLKKKEPVKLPVKCEKPYQKRNNLLEKFFQRYNM